MSNIVAKNDGSNISLDDWRNNVLIPNMNLTFYVDAENGDDNNPGTEDAPFKTIEKAVNSVPNGGYGLIKLFKQTHYISNSLDLKTKTILFQSYGYDRDNLSNNAWIENTTYISTDLSGNQSYSTTGFSSKFSCIHFNYVNIRTTNLPDTNLPLSIWEGVIHRADSSSIHVTFFSSIIELGDTDLIRIPTGAHGLLHIYMYNCSVSQKGVNRQAYLLVNEAGNVSFSSYNNTFTLADGSSGTIGQLISGQIVRDASTNIPLNFLTNFSL
jgi:hypothetical protein